MKVHLYFATSVFLTIILNISGAQAQIKQNEIYDIYKDETELKAKSSIILKPGFYIPAGKNVRIYITGIDFQNCTAISGIPSDDKNYILTRIIKVPEIISENEIATKATTTCALNQTVQYFDGLGRASQTVSMQASPSFADIIQPVVYDAFGREAVKYQPYTASTNNGTYRNDALTAQATFYANQTAGTATTAYPFSKTIFESSPLNRVFEQGSPGEAWQPASGHTLKIVYGTNVANEVDQWILNGNGAKTTTSYEAGKLYKIIQKNENWVSADLKSGTTEEYKDFEGHIILKRVWETDIKSLSTYYIYDELGNLSYVLPPAVNENGLSKTTIFSENDEVFKQYIYGYHYDNNRIVEKKLPGKKGWDCLIYNELDQVVLTQDVNQKAQGQWLFTKYDALGRIVATGSYKNNAERTVLQAVIDKETILWEKKSSKDYDNLSFPQSATDYYTVNYYDDYTFPGAPAGSPVDGNRTKSLLTGTKVNVLGTKTMLLSAFYYDAEGRMVQSKSDNYLGGQDIIDNTYSFIGELKESKRSHTKKINSVPTVIADRYFYDHIGRKIATAENINNQGEIVLNKLEYTEIGQLKSKKLHSIDNGNSYLQETNYAYNERGWLSKSTGGPFNMQLKYNDGEKPQWNGNIANQLWWNGTDGVKNTFIYTYDKLDRLTNAASAGLGESMSYDEMGNLLSLTREGMGTNKYNSYEGNRLTAITGFTKSNYEYDGNGNLISDSGKGIKLSYNYLNLPQEVTGSQQVSYVYDATGAKLKKISSTGGVTDYIKGIQYTAGEIEFIQTEEGLARKNGANYSYDYNLSDHLGNVRYTFNRHPVTGAIQPLQSDNYYAFGLRKVVQPGTNKYLYNKKELQEELEEYDYGARFYDPVIGRWNVIDPLSEKMRRYSPYVYGFNNPIRFIDPDGMAPTDIWQLNTETKRLTLVKVTNDKFHTFVDQNNKLILKTNDTRKEIENRISSNGGTKPASDFYEAVGDLGNAIRKNDDAFDNMLNRANTVGFDSKAIKDLKTTGENKVINGVISFVRDGMVGKLAGESTFATAKDIMDAPKTYADIRGRSATEDVRSVGNTAKEFQSKINEFLKEFREKMLSGAKNMQNGSF